MVVIAYGFRDVLREELLPAEMVQVAPDAIELRRGRDGHFHAELEVNGKPVRFMVDTGASDIVLSRRDAERVGLDPGALTFPGRAMTANGAVGTAAVRLGVVKLGGFTDTGVAGERQRRRARDLAARHVLPRPLLRDRDQRRPDDAAAVRPRAGGRAAFAPPRPPTRGANAALSRAAGWDLSIWTKKKERGPASAGVESPEGRLGELDGVAGGVADVDRAGAARPAEVGLDLDPGGDEAGAPAVELGGGGGEGDVAGAAGAVRRGRGGGPAGGRSVAAGSKTRSIASRRRKKTCLSPARATRSRPRTPA